MFILHIHMWLIVICAKYARTVAVMIFPIVNACRYANDYLISRISYGDKILQHAAWCWHVDIYGNQILSSSCQICKIKQNILPNHDLNKIKFSS